MFIEQLRRQPLLQIVWTIVLLFVLAFVFYNSESTDLLSISPFFSDMDEAKGSIWLRLLLFVLGFSLLFSSLFQLSSLLRNYHFTGDSRFDMLFFLSPLILLHPQLLFHIELLVFVFFLQKALKLQFAIHTQIKINREVALMALYLSIASLFFPKALIIAVALYLGILIQRGFYIKELLIYLIVLTLPYYFIASIYYLIDVPFHYDFDLNFQLPAIQSLSILNLPQIGFLLFMLFLLFKSVLINSKMVLRSKAQFRNFYNLLIIGFAAFLFFSESEGIAIAYLALFALFASTYPSLNKKWIYELLLVLLGIGAVITHLIPS